MKESWNARYSSDKYIYGKEPNEFLKQELDKLQPSTILFSAEGEGRNSVYAAKTGWNAVAFDISEIGRQKAMLLAAEEKVSVQYDIISALDLTYQDKSFDCLASIFTHFPEDMKEEAYSKMISKLKLGGHFIFEAFSKGQINHNSGGPRNTDLLFDKTELERICQQFSSITIQEKEIVLDEGSFHQGLASIIRAHGIK